MNQLRHGATAKYSSSQLTKGIMTFTESPSTLFFDNNNIGSLCDSNQVQHFIINLLELTVLFSTY